MAWNPRYAAYAHPLHPAERLRLDEAAGGGTMTPYILWNGERWREFRKLRGVYGDDPINATPAFHREFDAWLWQQVGVADPAVYMRSVNQGEGCGCHA